MKKLLQRIYIFLILLFLYAPIIVLIVFSFNSSKSRAIWQGFSLTWYQQLFTDGAILKALQTTMLIALFASIIATVLGTFAALGIVKMKKKSFETVRTLTYIPVLNPDIVTGVSLMMLFTFVGIELGFVSMLLAHITFCTPYVIISVLPKLYQTDISVYEAAQDLGAKPFYALRKTILPQLMPGIVTGFLLSFTLSVDDFVISYFTTGGHIQNLSMIVFSMARKGINPKINAVSTLMFITVMALLLIVNRRELSSKRHASKNKDTLLSREKHILRMKKKEQR